jgi:hypothetical protein
MKKSTEANGSSDVLAIGQKIVYPGHEIDDAVIIAISTGSVEPPDEEEAHMVHPC